MNEMDSSVPGLEQFELVAHIAQGGFSVRAGMDGLLAGCSARLPDPVWGRLGRLDLEEDVLLIEAWLAHLLASQPPPNEIDGFYFGLSEYQDDERQSGTICRLDVVVGAGFDAQDDDCLWAAEPTYFPASPPADSTVLKSIYREVQAAGQEAAQLGEYVLALGYGCLVVRHVADDLRSSVLQERPWRGLAVGFSCGDVVSLGRLGIRGWLD